MHKKDHDHEGCGCGRNKSEDDACCGGDKESEGCCGSGACGCDHGHDEPVRKTAVKPRAPNTTGIAGEGDVVLVHYTGTLDDGSEFDSSRDRDPLELTLGEHQVIKGFEKELAGMKKGEKKQITIEAADAYGDENPELRQSVPREALGDIQPEVGMMLALQHPAAPMPIPVRIVEVDDKTVTIDLNHPLAGKRLHFALELVGIQ